MRRLGLTLFACLLSTIGFAAEPHWLPVDHLPDYSLVVMLDTNSVKIREGNLSAWVQYNYTLPQHTDGTPSKDYRSSEMLQTFDCATDRMGILVLNEYADAGGHGEIITAGSVPSRAVQYTYFAPGSLGAQTVDAACSVHRGSKLRVASKPTSKPIQFVPDDTHLTNNRHYTNSDGNQIHSPSYTTTGAIPSGATAQCADGTYSFSQHHQGTCSHHGGVASWIN